MNAHTPGPWDYEEVSYMPGTFDVYDIKGSNMVCQNVNGANNARLIAVAPDLLEALRTLHRHCSSYPSGAVGWNAALNVAEAAIAKAEGT